MENSLVYEIIETNYVNKWRHEIKEESKGNHEKKIKKLQEKLCKELKEDKQQLVQLFADAIENKLEFINKQIYSKLLNLGIELGIELEQNLYNEK